MGRFTTQWANGGAPLQARKPEAARISRELEAAKVIHASETSGQEAQTVQQQMTTLTERIVALEKESDQSWEAIQVGSFGGCDRDNSVGCFCFGQGMLFLKCVGHGVGPTGWFWWVLDFSFTRNCSLCQEGSWNSFLRRVVHIIL